MASGLQCPSCGHVHPAGLPEIARGDSTFRCYGCYRMLSVPEGWTGRPAPRPAAPPLSPTGDPPPGAGMRDARAARLAGRGRAQVHAGSSLGPPSGDPTQMGPSAAPAPAPPAGPATVLGVGAATAAGKRTGVGSGRPGAAGWVPSRRSGRPVLPARIRVSVWAAAFAVGLMVTAYLLRKVGVLSVNAVIDLYAGTGVGRFGILLILLPMWAALSATLAHFSLEGLAKRRQRASRSSGPYTDDLSTERRAFPS